MGYSPVTGESMEDKNRPIADQLGTAYNGNLNANCQRATWEDLLAAHGWVPPGGRKGQPVQLSAADLTNLKDAWEAKTGWRYVGNPASACCSCTP